MKRATLVLVSAVVGSILSFYPSTVGAQANRPGKHAAPTITEVALHYVTSDGQKRILRIDPGHVDLMFFDDASRNTYFQGLGTPALPAQNVSIAELLNTRRPFFRDSMQDTASHGGFAGSVTFRANSQWYRLGNVAQPQALVLYYQSPDASEFYSLTLPLRSSMLPPNASADSTVDVAFWNMDALNAYRAGMIGAVNATQLINPAIALLNGQYKVPVVRNDTIFTAAKWMPRRITQPGAFRSTDSEICYHFENCQWVCTGN
jgi:hypothetical protein